MSKVFLLTGFNNWGKTTLITQLFGKKQFRHTLHSYGGHHFCVQSQSNDDLRRDGYEKAVKSRLNALSTRPSHIFTAFCPTKELNNDSADIIATLFPDDEVHVIAIEYKWCLHAKLNIDEIENYYRHLPNVTVHTLSEKIASNKKSSLDVLLQPLL